MLSAHDSLMMTKPGGFGVNESREAHRTQRSWVRWLSWLVDAVHELSAGRRREVRHEPVFRIAQIGDDRWVVERPGAVIEHAFADLEHAVAFVRSESATPATVELRIGDLYVVSRFDPRQPGSLFGEFAS